MRTASFHFIRRRLNLQSCLYIDLPFIKLRNHRMYDFFHRRNTCWKIGITYCKSISFIHFTLVCIVECKNNAIRNYFIITGMKAVIRTGFGSCQPQFYIFQKFSFQCATGLCMISTSFSTALTYVFLNLTSASHSSVVTNRLATCTPLAPSCIISYMFSP